MHGTRFGRGDRMDKILELEKLFNAPTTELVFRHLWLNGSLIAFCGVRRGSTWTGVHPDAHLYEPCSDCRWKVHQMGRVTEVDSIWH
jgi:hypothetical protein